MYDYKSNTRHLCIGKVNINLGDYDFKDEDKPLSLKRHIIPYRETQVLLYNQVVFIFRVAVYFRDKIICVFSLHMGLNVSMRICKVVYNSKLFC